MVKVKYTPKNRKEGMDIKGITEEHIARFWGKVRKGDGCWIWEGGRLNKYGYFCIKKRHWRAHRISYQLHNGSVKGVCVLHKCDNPLCVNPEHLFAGTQADNIQDMVKKGRNKARGKMLSPEDVIKIREINPRNRQTAIVAKRFGATTNQIRNIVTFKLRKTI